MVDGKADLVLRRGRVFRGLAEGFASAVAVAGGRILAAGADDGSPAFRG